MVLSESKFSHDPLNYEFIGESLCWKHRYTNPRYLGLVAQYIYAEKKERISEVEKLCEFLLFLYNSNNEAHIFNRPSAADRGWHALRLDDSQML